MNKILMYHSIGGMGTGEVGSELYAVPVEEFREQMQYISGVKEAVLYRGGPFISFDDGLEDNYTNAYPVLKDFGLKAYFFILISKVGTRGFMNWQQIGQLRNDGMVIGSHGMTHKILAELNDEGLEYELRESKRILEDKLRQPVEYFSIPRGFYNKKVIEKAKQIGYKALFTSDARDSDGFKFGRIPVKAGWSLDDFIRIINDGFTFKEKTEELLKNYSKKIIGAKNYDRLRMRILR